MTSKEWEINFDILYNNISSNLAPGLSIKEKESFLNLALIQIVKAYLDAKTNKKQSGYDDDPLRLIDFFNLTVLQHYTPSTFNNSTYTLLGNNRTNWHKAVQINDDMLQVVNESIICDGNKVLQCIPITLDEYTIYQSRPYKFPKKYLAWRILNTIGNTKYFELIAGFDCTIKEYVLRYVRKPKDIKLNGSTTDEPCELDSSLHNDVLLRAVELAKAAYLGTPVEMVQLNSISSTDLGILPTKSE